MKEINDSVLLEEFLDNVSDPVVVLYHAQWCAPCRKFKPHFAASAAVNREYVHVAADIDQLGPDYIQENSIMQVPTVTLYENGKRINIRARTAVELSRELNS